MICPNCDGILGGGYCQGCGWRTGDPWPAHRLVAGTTHPLKARELYPPDVVGVKDEIETPVIEEELHTPTPEEIQEPVGNVEPYAAFAEPAPGPEAPKKTVDKTVQ